MELIEFRVIPSCPDYEISEGATIRRISTGRILAPFYSRGYRTVKVFVNKTKYSKRVHRLLAEVYIPNPEGKPHINHKNGIKWDNNLSNLEWCTPHENARHAWAIGLNRNKDKHAALYARIAASVEKS